MIKKLFTALLLFCTLPISAAAVQTAFPVARTGVDGVTRYGYLDESGNEVLPFTYAQAGDFAECGLAAVENDDWKTAVTDMNGRLVVPYTESPLSVEFSADTIVYRYKDYSVYYSLTGQELGSYAGAVGFYSDGLLLYKSPASGLYSYLGQDGLPAIQQEFTQAGAFSDGLAVVQLDGSGEYAVIDTTGMELHRLPRDAVPSYLTVYNGDILILSNGPNQALYSIKQGQYITEFQFKNASEFHEDGFAMVQQVNQWGIIDLTGHFHTKPSYYYLAYMGDGLYAARSKDGSAAAVDADGNIVYRALTYVGGFQDMQYGLSWHGTTEGNIIFFRRNGGYYANLVNAENPTVLSGHVVRVVQDGKTRYINLETDKILFEQPTVFSLGQDITVKTVHYEKFLGYQQDGSSHGWNVDFPEIEGLPDAEMQKQINAAIREFFLKGPSVTAEYEALEGGYGVSLEGSVLVVSANCISGKGNGASVWNNSLAFDLNTGKQYELRDLLNSNYVATVKSLLPKDHPIYLYNFPRMSSTGVTYYYNEYENETRRAHTESFHLTFEQLRPVVNVSGDCFQALKTPYVRPPEAPSYTDMPDTHWAYSFVQEVSERGLMQGSNGLFRPDSSITAAEVCTTFVRLAELEIPEAVMDGIDPGKWYAGAVSAMNYAGLLTGLEETFVPEEPITRADAIQLFANLLLSRDGGPVVDGDGLDLLEQFSDLDEIPADRTDAVALCVQAGIIEGSGGVLRPHGTLTRAAFAKLLTMV